MPPIRRNYVDQLCDELAVNTINGNAIIYTRISTANQVNGTSLQAQLAACEAYCNENKYNIIERVQEIVSARFSKKQNKLLEIIENNKNVHIIIFEPSRFSRNVKDGVNLIDTMKSKKITLHFAQPSIISTNTMDMKSIISGILDGEIESNKLSMRIKQSVLYRKSINKYYPSIPKYGYNYERKSVGTKMHTKLIKNVEEYRIAKLINKLYYGDRISHIEKLLFDITGKVHNLYWTSDNDNFYSIKPGDLKKSDIMKFLDTIPILRRGRKWTTLNIAKIICEFA